MTSMRTLALLVLGMAVATNVDAGTRLKKPTRGFQMRVGAYTIDPGEDLEMCEYRRLPIKKPMNATSFTLRMPTGAHHFAMWGYGGALTEDDRFRQGPVETIGSAGAAAGQPLPPLVC